MDAGTRMICDIKSYLENGSNFTGFACTYLGLKKRVDELKTITAGAGLVALGTLAATIKLYVFSSAVTSLKNPHTFTIAGRHPLMLLFPILTVSFTLCGVFVYREWKATRRWLAGYSELIQGKIEDARKILAPLSHNLLKQKTTRSFALLHDGFYFSYPRTREIFGIFDFTRPFFDKLSSDMRHLYLLHAIHQIKVFVPEDKEGIAGRIFATAAMANELSEASKSSAADWNGLFEFPPIPDKENLRKLNDIIFSTPNSVASSLEQISQHKDEIILPKFSVGLGLILNIIDDIRNKELSKNDYRTLVNLKAALNEACEWNDDHELDLLVRCQVEILVRANTPEEFNSLVKAMTDKDIDLIRKAYVHPNNGNGLL